MCNWKQAEQLCNIAGSHFRLNDILFAGIIKETTTGDNKKSKLIIWTIKTGFCSWYCFTGSRFLALLNYPVSKYFKRKSSLASDNAS